MEAFHDSMRHLLDNRHIKTCLISSAIGCVVSHELWNHTCSEIESVYSLYTETFINLICEYKITMTDANTTTMTHFSIIF